MQERDEVLASTVGEDGPVYLCALRGVVEVEGASLPDQNTRKGSVTVPWAGPWRSTSESTVS